MNEQRATLYVSVDEAREISIASFSKRRRAGDVLFDREVSFDDGRRMALQIIASNENPGGIWVQAVLFSADGVELESRCSDDDRYPGDWPCVHGDTVYLLSVIVK